MSRTSQYIKGDIALIKVIEDLIKKGFVPLVPFSEQHSYDLVALNPIDNKTWRIQVKYMGSKRMQLDNGKHWTGRRNSNGYNDNSFDFYACYIPAAECVIYPSIKYRGKRINIAGSKNHLNEFYWYEDFLDLKDHMPEKRTRESLGLSKPAWIVRSKPNDRKVVWPTKEELESLVWRKPMKKIAAQYGVKDNSVRKWCKRYGITWPPFGYWQRINSGKSPEEAKNPPPPKPKQIVKVLSDDVVSQILTMLRDDRLTLQEIAYACGSNKTTVIGIRDGTKYKHVPRL